MQRIKICAKYPRIQGGRGYGIDNSVQQLEWDLPVAYAIHRYLLWQEACWCIALEMSWASISTYKHLYLNYFALFSQVQWTWNVTFTSQRWTTSVSIFGWRDEFSGELKAFFVRHLRDLLARIPNYSTIVQERSSLSSFDVLVCSNLCVKSQAHNANLYNQGGRWILWTHWAPPSLGSAQCVQNFKYFYCVSD